MQVEVVTQVAGVVVVRNEVVIFGSVVVVVVGKGTQSSAQA